MKSSFKLDLIDILQKNNTGVNILFKYEHLPILTTVGS